MMFFKSKQKYEPDAVPTTVEEAIPLDGIKRANVKGTIDFSR